MPNCRPTHFNNTDLYPTETFSDERADDCYLELCASKVTRLVHVIPHIEGEVQKPYVSLNKEEALRVVEFLIKEFILDA